MNATTLTDVRAKVGAALPVVAIGNDLATCNTYLAAVQAATLPDVIVDDPQYATLATAYRNWQNTVWEQFYLGLLDAGVMAQAGEMNTLIGDGLQQQSLFQSVVVPVAGATPTVIGLCGDMADQVQAGETYVQQLTAIVEGIEGADEAQLAQVQQLVNTLNSQFESLEDELTEKALDNAKEAVITIIKIGVNVATDEDPIDPLIDGVVKIGTDITKEVVISAEINATLSALIAAWNELDEITLQVAQLNLILQRLDAVTADTSETLAALADLGTQWQRICDVIGGPAELWEHGGFELVKTWCERITRLSFPLPVTQIVS